MDYEFEDGTHGLLQRRLRDTQPEIADNPALANGGRILNVLDIDAIGWEAIRGFVERDGILGLTAVPETETPEQIIDEIGPGVQTQIWRVFFGDPGVVMPRVLALLDAYSLPEGWRIESVEQLDDIALAAMFELNLSTGVRPTPAYFLRGEVFPSMTTLLWDPNGKLAGCGNATMRYHSRSRFADGLFAGAISVDPNHRGMGFGTLVNAALLRDSHNAFGWKSVLEQARDTNLASCRMLERCGLRRDPDLVTIGVALSDREFTR